jgi:hypothetical protein
MAKRPRDPFQVKLSGDKRTAFVHWLCEQIEDGLNARAAQELEVQYWWMLYEQARTRTAQSSPWPGAADLTSHLGTQNVDSLHARMMRTVNVEPMWTVDAWGPAANNAPFVEEFHQWKAEEERLQGVIDKLGLISLVEPRGLIEVYEGTEKRRVKKEIWAEIETLMLPDPSGGVDPMTGAPLQIPHPVFEESGQPKFKKDDNQNYIEAANEQIPSAKVVADKLEPVRTGPVYRILPYRDSLILPGHARDKEDIWGYAKRFWRRMPEIQAAADAGVYDKEAVTSLTQTGERESDPSLERAKQGVAPQEGVTAEKELWEVTVLTDLDGRGERWYVATVHLGQKQLLRLQHDDIDRSRFVPVILFPRADRVTEGYSAIGHKLITTIEEHTAVRNMRADRSAMVVQAPVKRMQGALWDPYEQPWGPSAVIDVRDMREVEAVQVPDVPASVVQWEQVCERTAERIMGVNDIASGQVLTDSKTLGEVQMATEQSFVRMDLIIRRFQEAMEDLFQIRHAIYKRMLAEQPDGIEVPDSVSIGLMVRGQQLPGGRLTAQMLEGNFRGKPRGSVESADPRSQRADFNQLMQAFPAFIQLMPVLAQMFGPSAPRAMLDQLVRLYRIPNRQAFLGAASMGMGMPGQPMLPAGQALPAMGGMPVAPQPAQVQ